MVLYDRRITETHGERMHLFVEIPLHQQQRMPTQQVRNGAWVATLEQLPFVLQYIPIRLRVGGKHRRLSEHVRREQRPVPFHPLVDERFRVGRLVGGDELQSLSDEREAQVSRRQAVAPRPCQAEEEEDGEESRRGYGGNQRPVHG